MDPPRFVTRRRLLAAGGAVVAGLAGCSGEPGSDDGGDGPTDDTPATGSAVDGSAATPRDPESLGDVTGTWSQRGVGPGHAGATANAGLPGGGRPYWRLRRIRSGPAVLAGGRLFHYAELNEDPDAAATLTPTATPGGGPAHIVNGPPYLVARDASDGRVEWTASLPDQRAGWPAVAEGRVVATATGRVSVHDAADGEALWTDDLGNQPLGDPTVVGDAVVVPLSGVVDGATGEYVHDPAVRAYGLVEGTERWTTPAPKRGLGVAAAGGTVAVVANDYDESTVVLGLDPADGGERWRAEVPAGFVQSPVADPAAAGGTLFVADRSETLHALAIADGRKRWTRSFESDPSPPAVDGDTLYVGAGQRVRALAAGDGSERWSAGADSVETWMPPAVAGGAVYAGARGVDASLYVLDAADGTERWRHRFPNAVVEGDIVRSGLEAQPTVAGGAVYAYAADGLYAFGPE